MTDASVERQWRCDESSTRMIRARVGVVCSGAAWQACDHRDVNMCIGGVWYLVPRTSYDRYKHSWQDPWQDPTERSEPTIARLECTHTSIECTLCISGYRTIRITRVAQPHLSSKRKTAPPQDEDQSSAL